ncbi:MAG TPA: glycosyltransferase [Myxococcales bacterium]|nr:glycosyltransferase [Myxococcales bacterium]
MKLVIQVPCFNEEASLPVTLAALPRQLPGIDVIEYLVVDDGSSDRTVEVAKSLGVHHVVTGPHRGLARTFMAGIEASIDAGADIVVNTDADNQYCADDIGKLVEPILAGKAEMVVGARPIDAIEHFSPLKKLLQKLGSWAVRVASGTEVADAPSGFRAISRNAAMQLKVFSKYSYTLETIIQAGRKGMVVTSVPIRTNEDLRPSRLVKSIASYVQRSLLTIVRIFMTYQPLRFFLLVGAVVFGAGVLIGVRFLWFLFTSSGAGHVQSLILASTCIMLGFITFIVGLLADIISVNRRLLEEINTRVWKLEQAARAPKLPAAGGPDSDGPAPG